MAAVIIRNLPEETHRALKQRASRNGRSTEAEIRDILEAAVRPQSQLRLGTALVEIGRRAGVTEDEAEALTSVRHRTPAEPADLK